MRGRRREKEVREEGKEGGRKKERRILNDSGRKRNEGKGNSLTQGSLFDSAYSLFT